MSLTRRLKTLIALTAVLLLVLVVLPAWADVEEMRFVDDDAAQRVMKRDNSSTFYEAMRILDASYGVYLTGATVTMFYDDPVMPLQLFKLSREQHSSVMWGDPIRPACWADVSECESDAEIQCGNAGHGNCQEDSATITPHDPPDGDETCSCDCQFDGAIVFIVGPECGGNEPTVIDEPDPTGVVDDPEPVRGR